MRPKIFLSVLCVAGLFRASAAAQPAKIIAVRSADLPAYQQALDGFQKALAAQEIDYKLESITLPDNPVAARDALTQVKKAKPQLVLALGGPAARLARTIITSSPVLFCMVIEADEDLSYGGVTLDLSLTERITHIFRSLPHVKKVGLIYNPARSPGLAREIKSLEAAGSLETATATTPAEVDKAFSSLAGKIDCFLTLPDPTLFPTQTVGAFLAQALERQVPVIGMSPAYVKAGAIAAFFADYRNNGELAAKAAGKILGGGELRDIPLMAPTKVSCSFNLVVARRLSRQIDEEVFKTAVDSVR